MPRNQLQVSCELGPFHPKNMCEPSRGDRASLGESGQDGELSDARIYMPKSPIIVSAQQDDEGGKQNQKVF